MQITRAWGSRLRYAAQNGRCTQNRRRERGTANARSEARQRDMEMVANDSLKQRELVPDARAVPTYWIPVEEGERAPPQPGDGARARWRRGPALRPAKNETNERVSQSHPSPGARRSKKTKHRQKQKKKEERAINMRPAIPVHANQPISHKAEWNFERIRHFLISLDTYRYRCRKSAPHGGRPRRKKHKDNERHTIR